MSLKINGVWTALGTPFLDDKSLDLNAFEKIIEMQIASSIDGIVISGTTGESPTLSVQEKLTLVRKTKALAKDRIKIMVGSGGNNTEQSVELSKLSEDAGADALLIVTPPYNKPSLAGLMGHFEAIAAAVKIPLCLYHVPGRTGQKLSAGDIAKICQIKEINSIKEASADLSLFSHIRNAVPNASLLSGDDLTFLPSLSVGGDGVISVISNVYPKEFKLLYSEFKKGNIAKALKIHNAMLPMLDNLFIESNPGPLKASFAIKNMAKNTLRLPLAPVTSISYQTIKSSIESTDRALREIN